MSNPTLKLLLALMIAIAAALVTQPMRATAINSLVITENSSTSLTAMLTTSSGTTSLTVTPNSADNWTITLTGVFANSDNVALSQFWTEPDVAGFVNAVTFNNLFPGVLFVGSDFPGQSGLADGTTDFTSFGLVVGPGTVAPLSVTFFDKGDVATAPDTGSTLGLLSVSVVALLGATRLRFLQLAA